MVTEFENSARITETRARIARLPGEPRLLGVKELGAYLGISYGRARDLVINGHLRRVALPSPSGAPMERILVDRAEVDAWLDSLGGGR